MKIMKSLEEAEKLSKNENHNDYNREKFIDELELEKVDLDYNTIHSEILENIIINEDDSGISDLDIDNNEEKPKSNFFQIKNIKEIIHKSVKELFPEFQGKDQTEFLIKKHIILKNNNKLNVEKLNKNKIFQKTDDIKMNVKKNEKKIINFKKYNHNDDPYSNFNNYTSNYEIKTNPKKRQRDNHPLLKEFNFKVLKKENIHKKVFRKFRKFIIVLYNESKDHFFFQKNNSFWEKFTSNNFLPPMKIESKEGKVNEYKSFNSQYIMWLFEQEGIKESFRLFIKKEKESIINDLMSDYKLDDVNDKDIIVKLKQYLDFIPEIYSNKNTISLKEEAELLEEKHHKDTLFNLIKTKENIGKSKNNINLLDKKDYKEIPI